MSLEFGLMNEIQVPRPWREDQEYETYKQIIAQAILADEVGWDSFWTVEHHFLAEFSHCSAPESLYPYIAAKTDNIRIGHGVRLLPFPYNHPVRVAEAAATLDLVCDGRLEFGTGRSVSWDELAGFGIDPKETRGMWEEALEVVVGSWTEDVFSYDGKYFNLPPRHVIPKPRQKPHPPLWCASTGPEAHELAGRKGIGLLSLTLLVPLEELKNRIDLYRGGIAAATPVGKFINDRAATFTLVHCAETTKEAQATAAEAFVWYIKNALTILTSVARQVPAVNPGNGAGSEREEIGAYEYLRAFLDFDPDLITMDYLAENNLVIAGDPDYCIERVRMYEEVGIDLFLPMMQLYDIPHDKVMRSIRLFGEHVMPAFKKEASVRASASS
ncbi:MAG: LLM class flavin-dependent oxidoreductase [Actinomycetota bacterium]|jgi:alkanesulfonate monooxygenase SsuD/methylene tetrahydromethanopterin reductase-like flavin-dependent oxidoreductase (luciferase family)